MTKRLFDFCLSLLLLGLSSPLCALVAVMVKLDSKGPILYRGHRIGKGGRPFAMLKFRTMVPDADKIGGPSTSDDDPRMTKVGGVLRRFKLDELPQLVNVLKGEMSFVGPRPEVSLEVDLYTDEERVLLTVRPGITDYASLTFHNEGEILKGSKDPHEAYRRLIRPKKMELGMRYVREQSFGTDLKILAMTFQALLSSRLRGSGEETEDGAASPPPQGGL